MYDVDLGNIKELKKCPFCGWDATLIVTYRKTDRPKNYKIRCTNWLCKAEINEQIRLYGPVVPKDKNSVSENNKYRENEEEYIRHCAWHQRNLLDRWNRRTADV